MLLDVYFCISQVQLFVLTMFHLLSICMGLADILKVYLFSLNGLFSYVQYSAYLFSLLAVKLICVTLETDSWKLF